MKADSGSLIYLLVFLALSIISAIGKNKKKVAQKPATKKTEPPQMDEPTPTGLPKEFEEIFGKVFGEEPPKSPEPEVYEEAKSYETIVPESYKPEYESLEVIEEDAKSLETINIKEKPTIPTTEPLIIHEEEYEPKSEILAGFEMKKAIIYAEIINRKYF